MVYGKQGDLVSYAMRRADDLANRWSRLFRIPPIASQPIIIRLLANPLRSPERLLFETNIFLGDDHRLRVQLDVFDLYEIRNLEFDWRIFHALFLRNAYTVSPLPLGSQYNQPPDWLVEAAVQDLLEAEQGDFRRAYAAALVVAQNLDLNSFLAEKPKDALSYTIYRVNARALLQSLMEVPQGAVGILSFLSNPTAWDGGASLLMSYFPNLQGGAQTLTKTWIFNLARRTGTQRTEPLGMSETERRLNAALLISLPDGVKLPRGKPVLGVEAIPMIANLPKYRYLLRNRAQDLLLLSFRAHPMYRALIDEYRVIVETLIQHPRKNLDVRIKDAEKWWWILHKRCADIEDYINWFEAESLADFLNPFQSILENDQRRQVQPWSSDAISRAVDAIEATGW